MNNRTSPASRPTTPTSPFGLRLEARPDLARVFRRAWEAIAAWASRLHARLPLQETTMMVALAFVVPATIAPTTPIAEDIEAGLGAGADELRAVAADLIARNEVIAADDGFASQLDTVLRPSTNARARIAVYDDWRSRLGEHLEPMMWSLARYETDLRARTAAYRLCPAEKVQRTDALLAAAERELNGDERDPFRPLVSRLTASKAPVVRTWLRDFARLDVDGDAKWRAQFLPALHLTMADDAGFVAIVDRHLGHADEAVRAQAALARGQARDQRAFNAAFDLLKSTNDQIRVLAAVTIGRYGTLVDVQRLASIVDARDQVLRDTVKKALNDRGIPLPSNQ